MKMILASVLTTILIVAMTLGAMFILVRATEYVTSLQSRLQRAAAMGAADPGCATAAAGALLARHGASPGDCLLAYWGDNLALAGEISFLARDWECVWASQESAHGHA